MSYNLKIPLKYSSGFPYVDLDGYIQGHVAVVSIYYIWRETLDTKSQ